MNKCSECDTIVPGHGRGDRLTCSALCKSRRTQRLRRTYWKRCARPECGKEFSTRTHEQTFCGRSCARKSARRPVVEHLCETCKAPTTNAKYCSTACSSTGRGNVSVKRWLAGQSTPPVDGRLSDSAKRYLLEESEFKCSSCGWGEVSPSTGYPVLCIVRLDGNKRNAAPGNLAVTCCNCATLAGPFDPSAIVAPRGSMVTRTRQAISTLVA